MGILVPVKKVKNTLEVEIPEEILPDEYKGRVTKRPKTYIVEAKTYIYRGTGPESHEGLFDAIRAAATRRYGVGARFSVDYVEERGYPISLKLIRIYYPPIPYIRREGRYVDVIEEPELTLRPIFVKGRLTGWRVAIPIDIVRKYSLYAFPRGHALSIYNPTLYFKWVSYRSVSRKPMKQLKIYHLGNYYDAWWDTSRAKWIWNIPRNTPCFEPTMTGINLGVAPSAQCFFEDDAVYIDIVFSEWGAKVVCRKLGYAYRNMVVRSYTLRDEFSGYKTEQCDIEVRATFVTPCPIEYYQSEMTHMKIVTDVYGEKAALNITCWNIIRYFGRQALKREYYYSPIESAARSEKMKETVGIEKNKYVDYQEVKNDRFFYVNKYVRIDKISRGKRKRYVYTTGEIDKRIVEAGGIVDEKGFVWEDTYKRITVDIDRLDEYEVANALKTLKENGFDQDITINLSPSGKGYHIIAWSKKGVPLEKLLKIREEAGDDPARIWFDSMVCREINVLFDNKTQRIITIEQLLNELNTEKIVSYNSFYDTFEDMERMLKEKGTWLTEEDFNFLKSLYHYKIIEYNKCIDKSKIEKQKERCRTAQEIFMKFLKYFKIKSFSAHNKIQVEPKTFRRKNLRVLFHIMPLTRGEYVAAIRNLVKAGKIKRVKLNNRGRRRYYYRVEGY